MKLIRYRRMKNWQVFEFEIEELKTFEVFYECGKFYTVVVIEDNKPTQEQLKEAVAWVKEHLGVLI